jgi:predicted membrane metal-binding protein
MGFAKMLIMRWRAFRFGDVAAVLLLAAVLVMMLVAFVDLPGLTGNWGFGPGWECSNPGKGGPVCLKTPRRLDEPQGSNGDGTK